MEHQYKLPEVWAGMECTISRLKSGYTDQLNLTGFYHRENDLKQVADLGIKCLRYPVLWEKYQPVESAQPDFSFASKQLHYLRTRKIEPIVGLLHHGSGPEYTDLLDPEFPQKLARYAAKVAAQFPWVTRYTPINEPLTTARFSGLYGHWYPHEQNDVSFVMMLINQLKGVVLSMQKIRKINPSAILIQTEDLGKTYSTALLQYQATMENHRRFLTHDILCGRFNHSHPLWDYFMNLGIKPSTMSFFNENTCAPDILGANFYCTSERFLDEKKHLYPPCRHGGNSIHEYADVEAIRVKFDEPKGFPVLAKELWERYKIPIAVTEVQMNCAREGQLAWFQEIYDQSCSLKESGTEIVAVTAWSLFGAFGWNRLLTCPSMEYERGAFDISSGIPRPTAMAKLIQATANKIDYPIDAQKFDGWWNRKDRYFNREDCENHIVTQCKPLIIIGSTGTLGNAFARACSDRSIHYQLVGRDTADICDETALLAMIEKYKPWAIINAAGFVRVNDAEREEQKCYRDNSEGPALLAQICKKLKIKLVTFSSDLVFDGTKSEPYVESDAPNPRSVYGKSKVRAEESVLKLNPSALIIRTSAFFSPHDVHNFIHHVLKTIESGETFPASNDVVSPTYVPHLVSATLDLLIDNEDGIWHLCNNKAISWFDLAKFAAVRAGFDPELIVQQNSQTSHQPLYTAMTSERGNLLPSLDKALDEYFANVVTTRQMQSTNRHS